MNEWVAEHAESVCMHVSVGELVRVGELVSVGELVRHKGPVGVYIVAVDRVGDDSFVVKIMDDKTEWWLEPSFL